MGCVITPPRITGFNIKCNANGAARLAPEETTKINHCDRFFVYDPDGNRIEIIQWLKPYDPAESGAADVDRG